MIMTELCSEIALPEEIKAKVLRYDRELDYGKFASYFTEIGDIHERERAYEQLTETLGDDADGTKMLTCQLHMALDAERGYREKGIDHKIFVDTMKCFTRFIGETKVSLGKWCYDRGWWSIRQITMLLFRIGELEYEFTELDGRNVINMHIPSDAVLTDEECEKSHKMAADFINRYYPQYGQCEFVCWSWLLSPNLKELLPERSHIIHFQSYFEITGFEPDCMDYTDWVFKTSGKDPEKYPENTSLQRSMKTYLLNGGKIGEGHAVWKM